MACERVVGIFVIDTAYSSKYDFCPKGAVGLGTFFIDHQYQGKGYGKSTVVALKPYLLEHYPQFRRLYLTVNCQNKSAYHCYFSNGFTDTGELYLGGEAGPQHIMFIEIG